MSAVGITPITGSPRRPHAYAARLARDAIARDVDTSERVDRGPHQTVDIVRVGNVGSLCNRLPSLVDDLLRPRRCGRYQMARN